MEQYIFFDKQYKEFFWSYDLELIKDNTFIHLITLKESEAATIHKCKQSLLQKENFPETYNTKFTDTIQDEKQLLEKHAKYIVNYYRGEESPSSTVSVIRETDMMLTKKQILKNINKQKYKEGAWFYKI